ncbi:hypothetical protein SAMN06309944_0727 [Micrococcales bacterium KH10]|nr:hypothetical protein SAMN06309944_0727 [Micrococcales bacterium KH10]
MRLRKPDWFSRWSLLAAAVAICGACTSTPVTPEPAPSEPTVVTPSVFVATAAERDADSESLPSLGAYLYGEILVADGCVYVTTEGFDDRVLPVFSFGAAEWRDGALWYYGTRYENGDAVRLSGGQLPTSRSSLWRETYSVPLSCPVPIVWVATDMIPFESE